MKIRIASGLSSVCCALILLSQTAQAETLQDIYRQAVENDHRFKAAQAQRDAGVENKNLSRAALLPQIAGDASWQKSDVENDVVSVQNPAKYDGTQTAYGVGLNQSIINLSNWHRYSQGRALADTAEAEFLIAQEDLILRASRAYFDALRAVDNLATAKAEEDALGHQLEQTKQRFAVGLTAITEVHEAQAAYDSATANRLVAAGSLGIAFEALEVLTGQSYRSLSPLLDDFPVAPPEPSNREEWVKMALDNNASLKASWFSARSAEANAKAAKADHFPTLGGSIRYGNTGRDIDDDTVLDQTSTTVQLDLSVPLYAGGGISASRRQAANQYVQARELYLQTQRDTVQNTRSRHLDVLTTAATVKARKQAITSSRSALEATQAGYDVGTRDLVDVLNAQRNLYSAQRDYFNALYSYVIATLQLKQAAGVLVAADVGELDQWLDKSRTVDYTP
jgi:type I secretion outer membrane protein, TolC family